MGEQMTAAMERLDEILHGKSEPEPKPKPTFFHEQPFSAVPPQLAGDAYLDPITLMPTRSRAEDTAAAAEVQREQARIEEKRRARASDAPEPNPMFARLARLEERVTAIEATFGDRTEG